MASFMNSMIAEGAGSLVKYDGAGNFNLFDKPQALEKYTEILKKVVESGVVKLVIFDLDNTLWEGEIMENTEVVINLKNFSLIKQLVQSGIVCSICSKNDIGVVSKFLEKHQLWHLLIFPQASVTKRKSDMIEDILTSTNLRAANTIFIDDEARNRIEVAARFYGQLICLPPNLFLCLRDFPLKQNDGWEDRLQQYKLMEMKSVDKKSDESEEMFLVRSLITATITTSNLESHISKIHSLSNRANQLNYCKSRLSENDISTLLNSQDLENGIVTVTDRYGDYGLVGFYCYSKKEHLLKHFIFSCRVLGMRVETAIFNALGNPSLQIQDPVSVSLPNENNASFIKIIHGTPLSEMKRGLPGSQVKIALKGGCNMAAIEGLMFQKFNITLYNNIEEIDNRKGNLRVPIGHTDMVLLHYNIKKGTISPPLPTFWKELIMDHNIFQPDIQVLIMDFWMDAHTIVYKHKREDFYFPFGDYLGVQQADINISKQINKQIGLLESDIDIFKNDFENIGLISEDHFYANLANIQKLLPQKALFILCLFPEFDSPSHNRVHLFKAWNAKMRQLATECPSVKILETPQFAKSYENDTVNDGVTGHFTRQVYVSMVAEICKIIELEFGN